MHVLARPGAVLGMRAAKCENSVLLGLASWCCPPWLGRRPALPCTLNAASGIAGLCRRLTSARAAAQRAQRPPQLETRQRCGGRSMPSPAASAAAAEGRAGQALVMGKSSSSS